MNQAHKPHSNTAMLFNSHLYIFVFLPIAVFGYYALSHRSQTAKLYLVLASLFFYAYWIPAYLILIIGSVLANYICSECMAHRKNIPNPHACFTPKTILTIGIAFNLCLLGYYKYFYFFIASLNALTGLSLPLLHLILPLAISFFTFQQIAYLVDVYQDKARSYGLLNYALFVTFFPQLIAGPIVHHSEMMPQFENPENRRFNPRNVSSGIFLFALGLFKKIVLADTFAVWATAGFGQPQSLTFFPAWATSLSYTFQIYFDFSGYTDMALGSALLFNIRLPENFNTPYRASNIQDFWRRWHMTLSRWLRDYLYIPLGGNRKGEGRTCLNLILTFLLGGLWHGAGWTFIAWGGLHGAATVAHKLYQKKNIAIPVIAGWLGTFLFVNLTWVFFRAATLPDAFDILKSMAGLNGIVLPKILAPALNDLTTYGIAFGKLFDGIGNAYEILLMMAIFGPLAILGKNSQALKMRYNANWKWTLATTGILLYALNSLDRVSEFLYFNF